ncbi:hypothetical protein FDECE_4245 [Fusarium decemcellulare]|nr:hypothetical protein FDECE_4245 [Fusarium decemcellulare]
MTQLPSEVCCRKPAPDADMHVYYLPLDRYSGRFSKNKLSFYAGVCSISRHHLGNTPPLVQAESNTITDQVKRNKRGCSSDHTAQAAPSKLAAASSGIELTEDSSNSSSGSKTS